MENAKTFIGLAATAYIMIVCLISIWPGVIAESKGRSFKPWYIAGIICFPMALLGSLLLRDLKKDTFN